MIGELDRPAVARAVGARRDHACRRWRSTGRSAPPTTAPSTAYLGDVLADCKVVEIEGARHFGPNTHPDAVGLRALRRRCVSRAATPPVT